MKAGAGSAGGGSGGEASGAGCPGPTPAALTLTSSGRVDLPVKVAINGTPAAVGQPGVGRSGTEFRFSALKFFLSEPALVAGDGRHVPAQVVDAAGAPLPYGIQLVDADDADADDAATQVLRLSAEVGSCSALQFGIGVPAPCNSMSGTSQASARARFCRPECSRIF